MIKHYIKCTHLYKESQTCNSYFSNGEENSTVALYWLDQLMVAPRSIFLSLAHWKEACGFHWSWVAELDMLIIRFSYIGIWDVKDEDTSNTIGLV